MPFPLFRGDVSWKVAEMYAHLTCQSSHPPSELHSYLVGHPHPIFSIASNTSVSYVL